MPGSPGRVTGTARVVRRLDELWRLQPGEILIAPVTTPGWTPAFATERIADGQRITVDGSRGVVRLSGGG